MISGAPVVTSWSCQRKFQAKLGQSKQNRLLSFSDYNITYPEIGYERKCFRNTISSKKDLELSICKILTIQIQNGNSRGNSYHRRQSPCVIFLRPTPVYNLRWIEVQVQVRILVHNIAWYSKLSVDLHNKGVTQDIVFGIVVTALLIQ